MPRTTIAQLQAEIASLRALIANPTAPVVASSHWRERDIACPLGGKCVKPNGTVRSFRTPAGLASHLVNFPTHGKA